MKGDGFTLVELLVVLAIISVLSSVVFSSLNNARAKARDARRVSDMRQIIIALNLFFEDNGRYPSHGIDSVLAIPGECIGVGDDIDTVLAPYISSVPRDPLHNPPSCPSGLNDDNEYFYYSYDSVHTASQCAANVGVTLAFNRSETNPTYLIKDLNPGIGHMNQNRAHYNVVLCPCRSGDPQCP